MNIIDTFRNLEHFLTKSNREKKLRKLNLKLINIWAFSTYGCRQLFFWAIRHIGPLKWVEVFKTIIKHAKYKSIRWKTCKSWANRKFWSEDWMLKQCILFVFLFGTRSQYRSIASRDICNIFCLPESSKMSNKYKTFAPCWGPNTLI
jgi:hypothetical protein